MMQDKERNSHGECETPKDDLRARNLEWFRAQFPAYHDRLKSYEPISELVEEGDGWSNVRFSGQLLYEPTAAEHIEKQLKDFSTAPQRLLFAPIQPANFDRYAANFLHDFISRLNSEEIEFHVSINSEKAYYAFSFGFGLGAHIHDLVEKTNCQALIIVEPNMEFIAQSLEVFDWPALHEVMDERGGHLNLIISDNEEIIYGRIRVDIRILNACSLDGAMFFNHYHNELFVRMQERIKSNTNIILAGLGFYFDETVMIANTYENLRTGKARMVQFPENAFRKYPVFIVASGPSLDKDIEWLKDNKENAVIFSCGSANMPLLKAGIVPDFQVEIENIPELYDLMRDTAKHLDISKTHLLTSTTVDARVPGFYDETSYYFRPALASFPLFAGEEDAPLHNGSPTVTNAALALVQNFGFREIYLFGVDMGSKVKGLKHSRSAWQNSDEGCEVDIQFNLPVRGNFGGTVYTYADMNWTRDEMELALKHFHRGRFYYNCSDGAYIKGALAKHAHSVKFAKHDKPKSVEVRNIVKAFEPYSKNDFDAKWNDADMREKFSRYFDRLFACLDDPEDIASKRALTKINKIFMPTLEKNRDQLGLAMTFRGTLWQAMIGSEYYMNRIEGDEDIARSQEIFKEELTRLFTHLRDIAIKDLGHLSEQVWAPRMREIDIEKEDWSAP